VTRYELLDRIGVGGMAEIFRGKAVAAGGFEKPVAIKRILPHLSQDKRFVELLIAEAKVLSLLKHRNIVQIFDVGLGDDGQYFLVMEYVDGKDLGAIQRGLEARRRRIPSDLALHVCAEICEALEHAHSARAPDGKSMSLVHRDVSPSNVLLSRAGEVKLTDFGIAKRAEQESTGHGAVRGKFAYISPEQARNQHVEPRSDVFSVGILLWELVTNRRLFSGLTDMEALRAVRDAKVPRPRELDGRLAPDIDALIMSTLAPEPRGRPTAGQLGARLRSMRYALEVTVGDPASELAKIIDNAEEVERQSSQSIAPARAEFEGSEATVIRIHTADAFSMRDKDGGVARAREVIDRFEEEETRQALLSRDQMAFLRASAQRDSGELSEAVEPPLPGVAPRRTSDELTRAHPPLSPDDMATLFPDGEASGDHFESDEATRLLAPAGRRTPGPERSVRPATQPPPGPSRLRPPTPGPPSETPPPGTIHERSGRGLPSSSAHPGPPAMASTPVVAQPPVLPPPPAMPPVIVQPPGLPPPPARLPGMPPPAMPPSMSQPPMTPLAMPPSAMPPSAMPPSAMPQPPMTPPMIPPRAMLPSAMPPPAMSPPGMPPPGMPPSAMPPGNYGAWGLPPQPPVGASPAVQAMYDRRPPSPAPRLGRSRRKPLQPAILLIGALIMALLAFAVTRACIHTATSRPSAESK
jgi:serine/threonine protein kinase